MKKLFLIFLLSSSLFAKIITPNDVYSLSVLIQDHLHFLLKHYKVEHHHDAIMKRDRILFTKLKPRNIWQKSYEILVKINMLRESHNLPRIVPIGIEAIENLNPDMVYGMNERILAELRIFETRMDIVVPKFEIKKFTNKIPLDNYNAYVDISASFDELNKRFLTPSYVYAETMRIYDEITHILDYLKIEDYTLPDKKKENATPKEAMVTSMEMLELIRRLQKNIGIESVDFSEFHKKNVKPSDVFTVSGLIISELQPIKAYIGLTDSVIPSALRYINKKPQNVEQLMRWNIKRLSLINNLSRRIL